MLDCCVWSNNVKEAFIIRNEIRGVQVRESGLWLSANDRQRLPEHERLGYAIIRDFGLMQGIKHRPIEGAREYSDK
jgi:hypothetical protein